MNKSILKIICLLILSGFYVSFAQNEFVFIKDDTFFLKDKTFNFLGLNAYYLQQASSDSRNQYIVDDVFNFAKSHKIKVIRTWAFNEDSIISSNSVIRINPYEYNEAALKALDYVIYKAGENNIKLVLTLANNYADFGGIPQYINWANKYLVHKSSFNHNDFFVDDSIKQWYKNYVSLLLERQNTYTGIKYKNDPIIFSFELMNEAENPERNFEIIKQWYNDMSSFIKSIDTNHLVTTGEIGYDSFPAFYSDVDLFYNSSDFLFNGFKGTSFIHNSSLNNIDYISYHCYPDGWGLSAKAGITWIKDHIYLSDNFSKPILLGEFGIKNNKLKVYKEWLSFINQSSTRSAIVWHYVHPDVINNDGYGFNQYNSPELTNLFDKFIKEIESDPEEISIPEYATLFQNYPNPFNPVTTIEYSLPATQLVEISVYNILGEKIKVLEKGIRAKGHHKIILSFDNYLLASGIYIYTLQTKGNIISKKMVFLK